MHTPDSTEQSSIALLLQSIHRLVGQRRSGGLEGVITRLEINEAELQIKRRR